MGDEELQDFDLSAFEVPAPPDDLADAVLARMEGTDVGGVVAIDPEPRESRRRRAFVIAGVAAAVLAASAGTYALIGSTRQAGPASGVVVAERAQVLELDGVQAELDPGADVRWNRNGSTLHVEQRAGTVAWRVADDQQLVIAAGVTVASVDASDASLRVEVTMNSMDARIIGTSAATAAIVAAVTVTVFHGTVKVKDHDRHTFVVAGGTHTVVPPQPAPPEEPVVVDDNLVAGGPTKTTPKVAGSCDEVSCVLNAYEGACCQQFLPDTLDRAAIQREMASLRDDVLACGPTANGKLKLNVKVAPDGSATSVVAIESPTPEIGACAVDVIEAAQFRRTKQGGAFSYPFVFTSTGGSCNASAMVNKGKDLVAAGQDAAALAQFEAALACKSSPTTYGHAFIAACRARNASKAKLYFRKLPASQRHFVQVCIRNGVAYEADADTQVADKVDPFNSPRPARCDAEALKNKGMDSVNVGQHPAALNQFEASLRCKPDGYVVQLAFLASCNSGNSAKAKYYYAKLTPAQQRMFANVCVRNKVAYEDDRAGLGNGWLELTTTPAGLRVLIDRKDTGLVTPVTGKQLELAAGKYRLTFVDDKNDDRFTYPVTIEAGKTVTMSKQLE